MSVAVQTQGDGRAFKAGVVTCVWPGFCDRRGRTGGRSRQEEKSGGSGTRAQLCTDRPWDLDGEAALRAVR